jgi:hypothetical protein
MSTIGTSMISAFDHVYTRLVDRLVDLTDDEYFWEPAPGGWSLRPGEDGRWQLDGGGGGGPAPEPIPITTIAWRVCHVGGLGLGGIGNWLFGDGALLPEAIVYPGRADEVRGFLDAHYDEWRTGLAGLGDDAWEQPLGATWGAYAESNTLDLALHVLDELVHHGAEVALLRDLYAARGVTSTP